MKNPVKNRKLLKKPLRNQAVRRLILLTLLILLFYFVFASISSNRILNNYYLGNLNIGGLRISEAKSEIDKKFTDFSQKQATFVFEDQIFEVNIRDLGVTFDEEATANQAYLLGKPGRIFKDLALNILSLFNNKKINSRYSVDTQQLDLEISRKLSFLDKPAVNADASFSGGKVILSESSHGLVVDRSKLMRDLALRLDRLSEEPIEVQLVDAAPLIEAWQVKPLVEPLERLLTQRVIFNHGLDSWRLEGDDLASMFAIQREGLGNDYAFAFEGEGAPLRLLSFSYASSASPELKIGLDRTRANAFFGAISKIIDRPTINATANFNGEKIVQFTPAIDGQKLNVEQAEEKALSLLFDTKSEAGQEFRLELPVGVTTAKVDNEKINSLGIKELVGKGISYFAGSIENRIFNVELAASRINGTLVAPGDTFSFNNVVGEVSGKTGYKQAYVISAGKTVLDDGGGVCQVSTTIFRAALNSGLPIVLRTAHAYRVGYYEQKSPGPGLDATVFSPAVDFKFRNDTDHYILVQSVFNKALRSLEVDIYGTRDGRTVEVSKPVVSNRTPAPPEIRQDDPTLPKGTVKQVDFAAEGADVYFTRKVSRDGRTLSDDIFKSRYKPWQAIFLVGTQGLKAG